MMQLMVSVLQVFSQHCTIHFLSETPDVFQVPTLDSLQPNLDEFMEHFESFTSMSTFFFFL